MDHFALPTDELARAQAQRTLHRNFQGYSTRAECDLIGFGASSIGKVGDVYAQNARELPPYTDSIDAGRLAIARGIRLSADDRLRRDVITQLMCNLELRFDEFEAAYGIHFADTFAPELARLRSFEDNGLILLGARKLEVRRAGRMVRPLVPARTGVRRIALRGDAGASGRSSRSRSRAGRARCGR